MLQKQKDRQISEKGSIFVAVWAAVTAFSFATTGYLLASTTHHARTTYAASIATQIDAFARNAQPGSQTSNPNLTRNNIPPPADVSVGIYLQGIPEVSIQNSRWTADFDIWFNWTGDGVNPIDKFQVVEGTIALKDKKVDVTRAIGGKKQHYVLYHVQAQIQRSFDIAAYPFGGDLMFITIEVPDKSSDRLRWVPDTRSSGYKSQAVIPDGFNIKSAAAIAYPFTYKTSFGDPRLPQDSKPTYSRFSFLVWVNRTDFGIYLKLVVTTLASVAVALIAFFIKPTDVDPRFGLGVGAFFAAAASASVVTSTLPITGTIAFVGIVNAIGLLTIFLTLVQSAISLHLFDRKGEEVLSAWFDKVSFTVFFIGYTAINIAIPLLAVQPLDFQLPESIEKNRVSLVEKAKASKLGNRNRFSQNSLQDFQTYCLLQKNPKAKPKPAELGQSTQTG